MALLVSDQYPQEAVDAALALYSPLLHLTDIGKITEVLASAERTQFDNGPQPVGFVLLDA